MLGTPYQLNNYLQTVPRNTLIFFKYLWPLLLLAALRILTAWAGLKLVGTVEKTALEIPISQASP